MDGTIRADLHTGQLVRVIQKHHQRTGELTEGFIQRILTSAPKHTRGIKVRLQTGEVGRVAEIVPDDFD